MKRLKQLLCNHHWKSEGTPSYYCSIFSIFAHPSSFLGSTYLVYWWGKCTKCGKEHRFRWFVYNNGEDKELCFHCRLYVSTNKSMKSEYYQLQQNVYVTVPMELCDNCGQETFNSKRNSDNWHKAVNEAAKIEQARKELGVR